MEKTIKVFSDIKEICSYISNADQELTLRNFSVYSSNTNYLLAMLVKEKKNVVNNK